MRLKKHILTIITAVGLGLTFGWGFAGHEAMAQDAKDAKDAKKAKTITDPKEFELYEAYNKATTPKDKVAALDKWKAAFPNSDVAEDRENMYLVAYSAVPDLRKAFDKAAEILQTRPNYAYALQIILSMAPQLNPIQPADLDTAERVSKHILDDPNAVFAAANKPDAAMKDEQWAAMKPLFTTVAQRTYAWVFVQRKDNAKQEVEITKYLQMDPTQAQFSYFLAGALLAQNQQFPEKQPAAIFHFARAAAYDGQNSLPEAQRKTVTDYVTRIYTSYHGSDQGLPELLALAKTNAFPPAGFSIDSGAVIAQKQAAAQAAIDAANPVFAFWRDYIKGQLTKDDGQMFFDMNMKDASIPSGVNGLMKLKAKLISQTPANKPKSLVLGLEKGDVPDVTLVFDEALPGNMEPGADLEFEGVAKSFTKEPFMLTLEVTKDQLVGWTGTNPKAPARTGAGKGKAAPKAPAK